MRCNYGRLCGVLTVRGKDIAEIMIEEGARATIRLRRNALSETRRVVLMATPKSWGLIRIGWTASVWRMGGGGSMWWFLPVTLLSAVLSADAFAQDISSGNYYLPFCKAATQRQHPANVTLDEVFGEGLCMGILTVLFSFPEALAPAKRSCPPAGSTKGQALRVVVAYLDARPAMLHEDFVVLATNALRDAWPCRGKP
jgi:hypothetical protein